MKILSIHKSYIICGAISQAERAIVIGASVQQTWNTYVGSKDVCSWVGTFLRISTCFLTVLLILHCSSGDNYQYE